MPAGRPSEYKPEYVTKVLEMAERGATDFEIADSLKVSVRTLYRWKAENEDFRHSLKIAKDVADERVVRSLYQRAIGYEQGAVKIFMPAGASKPVVAKYVEKIAPDTTAAIFWLKNRKRDEWRDKIETEHSGSVGVQLVNDIPRPKRD
jgi:Helix-turn-helix domain of resolvase